MLRYFAIALSALLLLAPSARADFDTATFEDLGLAPNTFKADFSPATGFTSGGLSFNNAYSGFLAAGFAVSSLIDNVAVNSPLDSADFGHQFGAYSPTGASGTGSGGSATYAVAYAYSPTDDVIGLPSGFAPKSIDVANTTYLASSFLYGDAFNHHVFAAGDYIKLNILGFSITGMEVGSQSVYLAGDAQGDYTYLTQFTKVDLSSFVGATSLGFSIDTSTSFNDPTFGPNVPLEFAIDNVVAVRAVPEPSSLILIGLGAAGVAALRRRRARAAAGLLIAVAVALPASSASADYDPQVGQAGSLGIAKASSSFTEWASSVDSFTRGPQDITNPSGPLASFGTPANALGAIGPNDGGRVVSLGDGGSITLGFAQPIANGAGADFAVFENGFITNATTGLAYLELAFVDVSSDGVHFFRFPSVSLTQTTTQVGGFGSLDARNLHDLAGKYIGGYGTGFDLSELAGVSPLLNVNDVTEVRITDVVGSIDPLYGTRDSLGNLINDPFKTPFASGGFDLNGVGVINVRAVPEPASLVLCLAGGGLVWPRRRASR